MKIKAKCVEVIQKRELYEGNHFKTMYKPCSKVRISERVDGNFELTYYYKMKIKAKDYKALCEIGE